MNFGNLSITEQAALLDARDAGRTIELYNANMDEWMITYRPTFEHDLAYRIAEKQAPAAPSYARG